MNATPRSRRTRLLARFVACLFGVAPFAARPAHPATAAPVAGTCTRFASPTGSDANPGTAAQPFATVGRLAASLGPGVVGCLTTGSYALPEEPAKRGGTVPLLNLAKGGAAGSPATLRNAPGSDARIVGRLVVEHSAPFLVIAGLTLDGGPTLNDEAPSVSVLADDVSLIGNTITAPTRICVQIGEYGRSPKQAANTLVEGNRIHHCGDNKSWGAPYEKYPHNQEHGIYVANSRNAVIQHNIIDHNDARGVQLFTDADGTVVRNNIIDANAVGVNIGGWKGVDEDGPFDWGKAESNTIRDNIITSNWRWAFDVNWDGVAAPTGAAANLVTGNCVYGADPNLVVSTKAGLVWDASNVWANPQFNNQPIADYRLKTTSPCIGKGVRPSIVPTTSVTSRTAVTARATLRPHRMTAKYFLRVRRCSNATCTGTFGSWINSSEASAVDVLDVAVSRTISGLTSGRSYQAQWVARQALLPVTNSAALVLSPTFIVKTPA